MARYITTLLVLVMVVASFSSGSSLGDLKDHGLTNIQKLLKQYQQNDSTMDLPQIINIIKSLDLKSILENSGSNSSIVSPKCYKAYKGLSTSDIFTYIDAIGKPAAGVTTGNLFWLGSYKECMDTKNAHYCTFGKIKITAIKQFVLMGLCVPEDCDLDDVTNVFKYASKTLASVKVSLFTVETNYALVGKYNADSECYKKEKSYSKGAIVMMFITALIALLCVAGTITEVAHHYVQECKAKSYVVFVDDDRLPVINNQDNQEEDQKDGNPISMHEVKVDKGSFLLRFMLCFSLVKNSKTLFDTNVPPGAITSINGIRTLSIMWVVLGHGLAFCLGAIDDPVTVFSWMPRFSMQGILNATVSVDTFFLLSGLLVSYLSLKRFNTTGTLPLLRYYLHRYIRLTPSYAYLVFFLAFLYPTLSDGPLWFMQGPNSSQSQTCAKYWWTNLLYINNFYPELQNMCFNWSWYLANDMQFYVISPIILFAMYKFKWIGVIAANGIFLLAALITNVVLVHTKHASPLFYDPHNIDPANSPVLTYMQYIYMKPYTRISPYLIGLILGYLLINKKVVNGKGKYLFYGIGWFVAVGLGLAVVYGPYSVNDYTWKEPSVQIYNAMFRIVWAIAVGWVIYACHNGYGGIVNDLMSWNAFIPLSRLTYATYLIHPMVIFIFYYSSQIGMHFTVLNYAFFFVAVITISFALAYLVAVCIEYPVFNLEKLVIDRVAPIARRFVAKLVLKKAV